MSTTRYRWMIPAVSICLLFAATLPVLAQEDVSPDDAVTDMQPPADDVAIPLPVLAPTPVRVVPPNFNLSGNPAGYVRAVSALPGTLFNFRYQLDTRLQQLRLGADIRVQLTFLLPRLAESSSKLNEGWQQILPPSNLEAAHQYALAAVGETDTAVQMTVDNFTAGGSSVPAGAVAQFDLSDRDMASALFAIDVAAGP